MAQYVTKIRTEDGDKQIDYNALANKPTAASLGALPSNGTAVLSERLQAPWVSGSILDFALNCNPGLTTFIIQESTTDLPTSYTHQYQYGVGNVYKRTANFIHIEILPYNSTIAPTARNTYQDGSWNGWTYDYSEANKPTYNNTTYTLTKSGSTITLKGSDGSSTSVTDSNDNTTYNLGSFGITATAAELNYCDGVTSNIQTQLNGKAASSHNHDAENITAGTLSSDRLPTVPVAKGGTGSTNGATGLKNLFAAGNTVLSSYQYGTSLPSAGNKGRIFFKRVSG